jgi:hypothetical protein
MSSSLLDRLLEAETGKRETLDRILEVVQLQSMR